VRNDIAALEIFLQFSRSEFGDNAHVVPRETQQYQRTDLVTGKVSTATLSWDSANVKKGLAELRSEEPKSSVLAAFGGELQRFLRECRVDENLIEEAAGKRPIRLTVRSAAAELYALPWELCRLEDSGRTLAQLRNCAIRYTWPMDVNRALAECSIPQSEGGRLLFAWSHGKEDDVPWNSHLEQIEAACSAMSGDDKWRQSIFHRDHDMIPHATFSKIYEKIEQAVAEGRPYRLVHVLCHGGKLEGDEGFGLVLTDDEDRGRAISEDGKSFEDVNDLEKVVVGPDRLATLFDGAAREKPRLVTLSVCLGAEPQQPGGHLGSVALALHRTGIESVIASRFLLSKPGSIILTRELYQSLLAGPTSVEAAVEAARNKLRTEQTKLPDYAALQLFQHVIGWETRPVVFRPYRGLRHYQESDAPLFFGRSQEIVEACQDLGRLIESGRPRMLFIMGASGTGKSSLVGAGIVPALQKARLAKKETPWFVVRIRPREGLEALEKASKSRGEKQLLLVVDQFEELFTDIGDPNLRNAFVQRIWTLATDKDSGMTAIITLRIDYLARCGEVVLPDGNYLDKLATAEEQRVFLHRMTAPQLREVIEGPADWAGLGLSEGLVERLVKDAGNEPGALPLLQIALEKLWENRTRGPDGREVLQLKGYENLAGELITKADGLIAGFADEKHKNAAKRLLVQLVDKRSEASPYTRRRVAKDELRKGPEDEKAVFDAVLEQLTEACLVVVSKDQSTGQMIVEIAHEQIVRSWKALDTWLQEEQKRLAEMARFNGWLEEQAEAHKRGESYFLTGGVLALACRLRDEYQAELRPDELELVAKSEKEAARIAEENRIRQEALRDSLLLIGASGLLANDEPVWASKVLLAVRSPAKTRGWFQAAVGIRRKIHLWSTLAGESIEGTRALVSEKNLEFEEIDDGRFVLIESEDGILLWAADKSPKRSKKAGRETASMRGPLYELGTLSWIAAGRKEAIEIASGIRILDRDNAGEGYLLAVQAVDEETTTMLPAVWNINKPEAIVCLSEEMQYVSCGGFSGRHGLVWVGSLRMADGYGVDAVHVYDIMTKRVVKLGQFLRSDNKESQLIAGQAIDGRHLLALRTNAIVLAATEQIGEGYAWRTDPWSELLFLGQGQTASFAADSVHVLIVDKDSSYSVFVHGNDLLAPIDLQVAMPKGSVGNEVARVQSADGKRILSVRQLVVTQAGDYRLLTQIVAHSADPTEVPLEFVGPSKWFYGQKQPPVITAPVVSFSPDGQRALFVQNGEVWLLPVVTAAAMVEELRRANRDCLPPDKRCEYLGETTEEAIARHAEEMRSRPLLDAALKTTQSA